MKRAVVQIKPSKRVQFILKNILVFSFYLRFYIAIKLGVKESGIEIFGEKNHTYHCAPNLERTINRSPVNFYTVRLES